MNALQRKNRLVRQRKSFNTQRTSMLLQEPHLTQVKLDKHASPVLLSRSASVMNHASGFREAHLPTIRAQPETQVLILRVHKEALIKKACFIKSRASQQKTRRFYPIHRTIYRLVPRFDGMRSSDRLRTQQLSYAGKLEGLIERREKIHRDHRFAAVSTKHPTTRRGASLIRHAVEKRFKGPGQQPGVAVQEQDEFISARLNTLITRGGEAAV